MRDCLRERERERKATECVRERGERVSKRQLEREREILSEIFFSVRGKCKASSMNLIPRVL